RCAWAAPSSRDRPATIRSAALRPSMGNPGRALCRPHLLQHVEFAHLWTEDVDNDVHRVDQHPIACLRTLYAGTSETMFLELALDLIRDGSDMTVRAAACDHHVVTDR